MKTVRDVMRGTSPTIRPDAPFKGIVRVMDEYNISAVPVVDEAGRYLGMVTEAAFLLKEAWGPEPEAEAGIVERWRHRWEMEKAGGRTAKDLLSEPPVVRPDMEPWEAAGLMYESDNLRLPVVDAEGNFAGIVTWRDLLQVFLRDDEDIRREIVDGFLKDHLLADPAAVDVRVDNGVVRIVGQLDTPELVDVLLEQVRNVEGVVDVEASVTSPVDPSAEAERAQEFGGSTALPPD